MITVFRDRVREARAYLSLRPSRLFGMSGPRYGLTTYSGWSPLATRLQESLLGETEKRSDSQSRFRRSRIVTLAISRAGHFNWDRLEHEDLPIEASRRECFLST